MRKFLFAIMILSVAIISAGCSTDDTSEKGLKIGDIAGKWSVTDIYNLYFTDSWDNIENVLGDDYIYVVFDNDHTYSGKFGNDLFTGSFTLEGWNVIATATKTDPGAVVQSAGNNGDVSITYAMSNFEKTDDATTAEIDITFGGSEDGTMTVKVKKTE